MAAGGQHRQTTLAWLAAALLHLGLLGLWQGGEGSKKPPDAPAQPALDLSNVELVALPAVSSEQPGEPLPALVGASDRVGADPAEAMRDSSDAPGSALGSRAPGATGPESFADRSDSSQRSSSVWNTKAPSMMPHTGERSHSARSPESLERSPKVAFGDRARRKDLARAGAREAADGLPNGDGPGGAPGTAGEEWLALDPRFDSAPLARQKATAGAIESSRESALKDRGAESTEQPRDGKASESFLSPDRSNRQETSLFHLGAPTSGAGKSTGAGGKSGRSSASHSGKGSAAQSGQGKGRALASTRASRSNPYFHEMYRRIDKELRFPKKLALALEQGDLVLSFHLDTQGRVQSLKVAKGSGFREFDTEAVRAFRAAAPFGAVPRALLGSRDRVRVIAPYYFRNPLIR